MDNEQNYPLSAIEFLRQLVERYETMDAAIQEFHELQTAVWRLRKYIPGDDAMTCLDVIDHIESRLRTDAESKIADILKRNAREGDTDA
jgi:hypothetical protein